MEFGDIVLRSDLRCRRNEQPMVPQTQSEACGFGQRAVDAAVAGQPMGRAIGGNIPRAWASTPRLTVLGTSGVFRIALVAKGRFSHDCSWVPRVLICPRWDTGISPRRNSG